MRPLDWFPKINGAGDIDGAGSKRLLGKPDLDVVKLVVRETAQNSWDARLSGVAPRLEYRVRRLDSEQMSLLRDVVFTATAPQANLASALMADHLDVLEIADRNTTGLAGILRNDLADAGPSNWCDFVLSVGASLVRTTSGGTYGFGKTATYQASDCATILIWSVTMHEERLQHRFIASAMDDGFTLEGTRYTGRQWWGRINDERIEPVLDDEARRLGERLFERHFGPGETGTSILVFQPRKVFVDDPEEELSSTWAERLPGAVVRSLWPKLIPGQDRAFSMDIRVFDHGREVRVPGAADSPTLAALHRALEAVRSVQATSADSVSDGMTEVHTMRSHRPKEDLATLGLVRYLRDENDHFGDLAHTITFVRAPELVVRALPYPSGTTDLIRWVAVLKPLLDKDGSFAMAEPPAHDDWVFTSVDTPRDKSRVKLAIQRAKEAIGAALRPSVTAEGPVEARPTGIVSAALSSLSGAASGARPTTGDSGAGTSRGGRARRSGQPRIEVLQVTPLPRTADDLDRGRERSRVEFTVKGLGDVVEVFTERLAVAVDGRSEGGDLVRVESWLDASGTEISDDVGATVKLQEPVSLEVSYPAGVAIDLRLGLGAKR